MSAAPNVSQPPMSRGPSVRGVSLTRLVESSCGGALRLRELCAFAELLSAGADVDHQNRSGASAPPTGPTPRDPTRQASSPQQPPQRTPLETAPIPPRPTQPPPRARGRGAMFADAEEGAGGDESDEDEEAWHAQQRQAP